MVDTHDMHNGNVTLRRIRHKHENNIKMDVEVIGCESVNWIEVAVNKAQ
jgi:hypothetical protein